MTQTFFIGETSGASVDDKRARLAELLRRKAAEPRSAPLSVAQERLWFLHELHPGSPVYNVPTAVRLDGVLDLPALRVALARLVARHEALRTTFAAADGEPRQVVHPAAAPELAVVDLSAAPPAAREAALADACKREARRPFDLLAGPVVRATLYRLTDADHVLLLVAHHLVCDGWSLSVVWTDLARLYAAAVTGGDPGLAALPTRYTDWAAWQRERVGRVLPDQLAYWTDRLANDPGPLELPADRPRPAAQSYRGGVVPVALPADLTAALKAAGRRDGATLFMVLVAALQVLLYRYTGRGDLSVGVPVAGRGRTEAEGLVGLFVNTLVLRTAVAEGQTVRDLVRAVRAASLDALARQDVPFEKLVDAVQPARSMSHSPLFQVMFVLQNAPAARGGFGGLGRRPYPVHTGTAKFDLTVELEERDGGLVGHVEFNADLFDPATAARFAAHYRAVLEGLAAAAPEATAADLPVMPAAERDQLLTAFAAAGGPAGPPGLLHAPFDEQARRTPDAAAVEDGAGNRLTYRELADRADALAGRLRALGVGPDDRVGVCLGRTPDLLAGLLGVLKAGAAYVPLDPAYPAPRLAHMLADSGAKAVVADARGWAALPPFAGPVIGVAQAVRPVPPGVDCTGIPAQLGGTGIPACEPSDLAYVIYTSGSTGTPKGVAVEHRSAAALIRWAVGAYPAADLAGVLASTSACFDISVFEFFAPLAVGGRVVLVENALAAGRLRPDAGVTLVNTVPSVAAELVRAGAVPASVRVINLAGEPLPAELADELYARTKADRVYDLYGPTEDTVYSTGTLRRPGDPATIGRPLPGTRAYVLDPAGRVCPVGVPGELYLGGEKLARGYLGRPELTAERFVTLEIAECGMRHAEPQTEVLDSAFRIPHSAFRAYRTGDRARWRADGRVEYLGRLDQQVKVRGFRVELGEVEARLRKRPGVADAVAAARGEGPAARLVAWVVPADPADPPDPAALRDALRRELPEFLVPAAVGLIPAIPRSPSGKADRTALPDPAAGATATAATAAARTEVEAALAGIWADVLGGPGPGPDDDFFNSGGHSLLALRLVARAEAVFGKKIGVSALLTHPTVAALARVIAGEIGDRCWATLQWVQPGDGGRPPLFCVASPRAETVGFGVLARHLGAEQGVGVLRGQYRGEDDAPYSPAEYEGLAAEYLRALRAARPRGPYHLAGMCQGAHVMFEMARRLHAEGEAVPLVAVLDAWPEENTRVWWRWRVCQTADRLRGLLGRLFDRPAAPPAADALGAGSRSLWVDRYWPGPDFSPPTYPGRVTVFRTRRQLLYRVRDPLMGWGARALGGVDVRPVPGTHMTLLREPHVRVLAAQLGELLASAATAPPG